MTPLRLAAFVAGILTATLAHAQCRDACAELNCTPSPTSLLPASVGQLNLMLAPEGQDDPGQSSEGAALSEPARPLFMPPLGERAVALRYTDRLRSFYRNLSSVHLEAGVWISQSRSGEGSFEYWESGGRYFLRSTADPRLGLAEGIAAAYDGERFAMHFLESSRLSLWNREVPTLSAPVGNPLFLPLIFLGPYDEGCATCNGNLQAVLDEARWERVGQARGIVLKAGRARRVTLILPGGEFEGQPYYFRVLLNASEQVQRIEFVRPDGEVFGAVALTDYRRVTGSAEPFPHHLVSTSFDSEGRQTGTIHFMIKRLEVNQPIEPERFTISPDVARTVIDEEARTFLKHPQLKKD